MSRGDRTLVISGLDFGDTVFNSDRGSWNVTRALRDCLAGQHGEPYPFELAVLMAASANVDIDEAKVGIMVTDKARLLTSPPLIFVEDEQKVWMIDGHHRTRAMARLGFTEVAGYVIRADVAARYRVTYNGRKVAPWYRKAVKG
jgi:hypothetical protein